MTKCDYCKIKISNNNFTFSGIPKKKFCSTCWYKIYDLWKSLNNLEDDPELLKYVLKINK